MAVLTPSKPPSGFYDLINWDIPIIATDSTFDFQTPSNKKIVSDYVIPELIASADPNSEFTKFLAKLQTKFASVKNDQGVLGMVKGFCHENSMNAWSMAVVFIFTGKLVPAEVIIKVVGKGHIIRNRGDTPFKIIEYTVGSKNLLTPYLAKELKRMHETGLSQLWYNVLQQNVILRQKDEFIGVNKYFEVVQHVFGNVREPVTFHESHPVSVDRILPVFVLCSAAIAIGVTVLMVEYWKCRILQFFIFKLVRLLAKFSGVTKHLFSSLSVKCSVINMTSNFHRCWKSS